METNYGISSPWEKVYWFARMLINSDQYGGIGSDSHRMNALASAIKTAIEQSNDDEHIVMEFLNQKLKNILLEGRKPGTSIYHSLEKLYMDLQDDLITLTDFKILCLTCEKVLVPINSCLGNIPSNDSEFVETYANTFLKKEGAKGLANIINILDNKGLRGSLECERKQLVASFSELRKNIENEMSGADLDSVLTAFCQEFERRVGQKRKGRAGRGVEGATSLIFRHFGIKASQAPEHFTTGLEIDRWVRTKEGWYIGISCKRTLRERWKQAYTTDLNLLNRHKIQALWHVLTYDKDLSDEKLTEIGSHRAVLYLPDDSPKLKKAGNHPGMKEYVRPMSSFIDDLKSLVS